MAPPRFRRWFVDGLATVLTVGGVGAAVAGAGQERPAPPRSAAPVERVSPTVVRVGNVLIDTARKEATVPGVVLDANVLEFVAVTKGGQKAYESALELDTNAINFNLAMILLGLDQARSTVPTQHLDPTPPKGDPVELWVEWNAGSQRRRVRAEELIYNIATKQTLPVGPWVYTGSVFSRQTNAYLADIEGSLIGFAHTPATVIDSPRLIVPGTYGNDVFNPSLGLKPGAAVQLIVRALPRDK